MKADYALIGDVLEKSRNTFDKWRYFEETSTTKMAAERTLNHELAQDLETAARVIIDECAIVGLKGELRMTSHSSWTATLKEKASAKDYRESMDFEAESGESAIVWCN